MCRQAWRILRLIRFLVTAGPSLRPAMRPTRAPGSLVERLTTVRPPTVVRSPCRNTSRKRAGERSDSKCRSGGESLTALVTARLEHCAPGAGLHAVTESVTALATTYFGLIGALHG